MGMNELSESIYNDRNIFAKAVRRAKVNGVEEFDRYGVIVFLEKEIDSYRERIEAMHTALNEKCEKMSYYEERIECLHERLVNMQGDLKAACDKVVTLESAKENTAGEIIKALSDNGYTNISVNFYKTESEE